jgi:hypothetical protein
MTEEMAMTMVMSSRLDCRIIVGSRSNQFPAERRTPTRIVPARSPHAYNGGGTVW